MKIAILILSVLLIIAIYKACLYRVGVLALVEWIKEHDVPIPTNDESKALANKVIKNMRNK